MKTNDIKKIIYMKNLTLGKITITIVSLFVLLGVFYLLKNQYDKIIWQKSIKTAEHQLQLGSYIFSKSMQSTGNQSHEMGYFVFKVVHLDKDFVKLAVVRQLSLKDNVQDSDFSTSSEQYKAFKNTVNNTTITAIQAEDLYKGNGQDFVLNEYLLNKYPALNKSRYFYEDVADALKNKPAPTEVMQLTDYMNLVYSREKIIKNGKLYPYSMDNYYKTQQPELYPNPNIAEDIQLIINKK
jgi:hypothetical protein